MSRVRLIALGSRTACDDEAGLLAAQQVGDSRDAVDSIDVVLAGRPGPGLVDLLDPDRATVIVDAIQAGLAPGEVVCIPLAELPDAAVAGHPLTSHGLGPAEALRLAQTLGRALPRGTFVGIQAAHHRPGQGLSPEIERALPELVRTLGLAIDALKEDTDA